MKPLKITEQNAAAITTALDAVNGKARAHAFTEYADVASQADQAEKAIRRHVLARDATGAAWVAISGESVNNTYARKAFDRVATRIVLERRASGWFLVDIGKTFIKQAGGGARLVITQAQAEIARANHAAMISNMLIPVTPTINTIQEQSC